MVSVFMVFSPRCPICGEICKQSFNPCTRCSDAMIPGLNLADHYQPCSRCSSDLAGSDDPCFQCRSSPGSRDLLCIAALGPWMGPMREWISLLKYGGDSRLARWLGSQLFELLSVKWPGLPVVPFPPRKGKLRREGRDAVRLLGKELEKRGVAVLSVLRRTMHWR